LKPDVFRIRIIVGVFSAVTIKKDGMRAGFERCTVWKTVIFHGIADAHRVLECNSNEENPATPCS
jgi:hypothetical protein